MGHPTERAAGTEVFSARPGASRTLRDPITSAWLVDALLLGGFEIFRVDPQSTILERTGRAVVVPNGVRMRREVVDDLRRIAGVTASELDALLIRCADPTG